MCEARYRERITHGFWCGRRLTIIDPSETLEHGPFETVVALGELQVLMVAIPNLIDLVERGFIHLHDAETDQVSS